MVGDAKQYIAHTVVGIAAFMIVAISFPPRKDPTGLCRHDMHVLYDICSAHVLLPVLAKFVLNVHIGAILI